MCPHSNKGSSLNIPMRTACATTRDEPCHAGPALSRRTRAVTQDGTWQDSGKASEGGG
jgi:hypothetical protein